jgi:phenylpyruvate tautomerase PptA (4-oxalocrotonate tautomerase family)
MPLVRIDIIENRRTPAQVKALADAIQQVMLDTFDAPVGDRYQVITEHKPGHIIVEDSGLGFQRSVNIVVVQIFQQGRDEAKKVKMYQALAERLEQETGLSPEDLIISVTANTRGDWSFGRGTAQFLEGHL